MPTYSYDTLAGLRTTCDRTGYCTEYYALLSKEERKVDEYTASANQTAVTWGVLFCLIGLIVLLAPSFKSFRRIQKTILPKLAVVLAVGAPMIVGVVLGFIAGVTFSFLRCYEVRCSHTEEFLPALIIPAASLLVTIPITIKAYRKRQNIAKNVSSSKSNLWLIFGIVIIILAVFETTSTIVDNNRYNSSQKDYLRNVQQ